MKIAKLANGQESTYEQDLSLDPTDVPLPETVAAGIDMLRIVGAMAGG